MATTVLLVCGDKTCIATYASYLKKDYTVFSAHSGRQALAQAKAHRLDAAVIDTTSPRLNCKRIYRKLRAESNAAMVLIAAPNAKMDGASAGAVVVQTPVVAKKLLTRLKTAMDSRPPKQLAVGLIALDLEKRRVARGSKTYPLTPKEFYLLKLLMGRAGQTITRKTLMKEVWETDYLGDTRTLDVHIRWVREKVEDDASHPRRLVTMRGQGYRFVMD